VKVLRYGLATVGAVVLGLALALVTVPDAVTAVRVDDLVALLGNDYLLVVPAGVLAAVAVLSVVASRLRSGVDEATPPDPEGVPTGPHPGSEFDDLVDDGIGPLGRLFSDRDERVRDHLRRTAVRTVMRADNCSREVARERVARGEWTNDRGATAFVNGADDEGGPGVLDVLRGDTRFQQGVRRTALAIAHYEDGPVYADGGASDRGRSSGTMEPGNGSDPADGLDTADESVSDTAESTDIEWKDYGDV
jgi:hypothetical protein